MSYARRKAREAALRTLYQVDVSECTEQQAFRDMLENVDLDDKLRAFAEDLVRGAVGNGDRIRDEIESRLRDWSYERLAVIDRCVLRVAVYELLYEPDIPPAVSIDEAVDIAKKYGSAESGAFVNGVLAGVLRDNPKGVGEAEPVEAGVDEPEPSLETVTEEEAAQIRAGFWKVRGEAEK